MSCGDESVDSFSMDSGYNRRILLFVHELYVSLSIYHIWKMPKLLGRPIKKQKNSMWLINGLISIWMSKQVLVGHYKTANKIEMTYKNNICLLRYWKHIVTFCHIVPYNFDFKIACGHLSDRREFYLFLAPQPWWRHDIETLSALLAICEGVHRLPVDSSHKRSVTQTLILSSMLA